MAAKSSSSKAFWHFYKVSLSWLTKNQRQRGQPLSIIHFTCDESAWAEGRDFKGEVLGYLCVPNKDPGTEVVMLAECIKHSEMVVIKTLTDHLLSSPEGAG